MRRINSLFFLLGITLSTMAQGWPGNYGGVMLQGFYWDGYADAQWARIEQQSKDIAKVFDLVWLPQSGYCGGQSMGYNDLYWFPGHYDSSFGTEQELRSLIQTLKDKGVGTIADVVINHRKNVSNWVDFPTETYNGVTYEMTSTDICSDDDGGAAQKWASQNGYSLSANKDTGEDWPGMRDLDHKSNNVQTIVKAYLSMLLQDMGYAGFRYDMVKGYSGEFTKLYNEYAKPRFSVGECWDSSNTIRNWINKTGKTSAAFDFQFRYTVRNAANNGDWRRLAEQNDGNWPLVSDNFESGGYRQWAVTFVENHDTEYRSASDQQDALKKDTLAANAYMMAMPGTPCMFMKHWQAYKQEIANMVTVRKAVGITNMSDTKQLKSTKGYYVLETTGTKGKLVCVVGSQAASYRAAEGYQQVLSGYHFAYFVSGISADDIKFPEVTAETPKQDGKYAGVPSFCTMAEGEQCAFFESPISWGSQIFVWAWMDNAEGKDYLGVDWPGVQATKLGIADNGNSVWKWNASGTKAPQNIIFSGGGQQTPDMKFTNGGYYFGTEGLKATVGPTAIKDVVRNAGDAKVYSLDGRLLHPDTIENLPKGIYIINNKKVIVR